MTKVRKKIGNIPINTIKQDLQSTVDTSVAQMQQDVTNFIDEETAQYPEIGGAFKFQEDPEGRSEITTDSEGKAVSYRDSDGVKHEEVGIMSKKVVTEAIEFNGNGHDDFMKVLNLAVDYSNKGSMQIPVPRLAHLNIITTTNLSYLTKEGIDYAVEGVNYNVPIVVEFYDGNGNYFKKYGLLSAQGRSSLRHPKRGLAIDFFNENPSDSSFDEDNTFVMKFGDWVSQDSFHIKSYYSDATRCITPVVYQLANEVQLTRGIIEDRPYKKYYVGQYTDAGKRDNDDLTQNYESGARCIPAGFPVIVYQNGNFWGVNSWQLKKHRNNYQMSKSSATNIHLDGVYGRMGVAGATPFFEMNGVIDWNRFTQDANGIEIRNPKDLYCIDGKKYNVDTNNKEIIDTATAEAWISASVIAPTGKTVDNKLAKSLRTTGKVRASVEQLTTYLPYIDSLINGGSSVADIKAAIEERFDVPAMIDYLLMCNLTANGDGLENNGQITTWGDMAGNGRLCWNYNIYDCDLCFGAEYTNASAASNLKLGNSKTPETIENHLPFKYIWDYYLDDLKVRYAELRDAKIFDANHIVQMLRDWMDRVGIDNYEKEFKKWPNTPSYRPIGTYDDVFGNAGYYTNIYRFYLWLKKRIEYMDAQDFFDYNN